MKEHTRNVAVGLTVLIALAMFGGMILMFTGLPELFQTGRTLKIKFKDSYGARSGEWVYMSGMTIGKITSVRFVSEDPNDGVLFICRIDPRLRIPATVQPVLSSRAFGGGSYLDLRPDKVKRYDPATHRLLEFLPADWPTPLEGKNVSPSLLPKQLTDGLSSLSDLAKSLKDLISGPTTRPGAQPTTGPATITGAVASFKQALDDIHKTLGDKQNQANLAKALAALPKALDEATNAMKSLKDFAANGGKQFEKTMTSANQTVEKVGKLAENTDTRIGEITTKIVTDAERLSKVLDNLNRIVTKMDNGKGTVPKLLNDPELYDSFLQTSQQLTQLAAELRTLIKQWKKGGIPLKVK